MPEATKPFKIIIAGGGIAGFAAAIALRKPGREIVVLESSRMNKEIGASISLQPNAVKMAQGWGIEEDLIRLGGQPDSGFRIYQTDGTMAMNIPFKKDQFGADRLVFHRVDLHEALKKVAADPARAGPPVEVRVSSKVVSVDCEEGVVMLEGGETVRGDLVIGADGIHSNVRTSVLGEKKTAVPTGLSAYRLLIPRENLDGLPHVLGLMNADQVETAMIMGHSCRIVMGPCRDSSILSMVCLVPDAKMNEQSTTSWTAEGSLDDMLESFADFPEWTHELFKRCPDTPGLWQLRDLDPLDKWVKGRTILIGDAAHSMLPLQGQGASQSFEDAEALGAYLDDLPAEPTAEDITERLENVFKARHKRASLIQGYSRAAAKPATEKGSTEIKMNPMEFMKYNCDYKGAKAWAAAEIVGA